MTVVYRHRTIDTNEVFYIGIGSIKRSKEKSGRSKYWNNIVNKHGYSIEIISEYLNWKDACELEEFLIELYGRRDLDTGCLVNLTNGGEGSPGVIISQKTKIKLKIANKGKKLTQEHKDKISNSNKGKIPSSKVRLKQIEKASKKVINLNSNEIYNSAKEVSKIYNLNYLNFIRQLNGYTKNKTNFKYLNNG